MPPNSDTIFALSSGRLPAAIAVIRISGPRARDALLALTGRVPEPRRAALVRVRDPQAGEVLDEALALFFPGPNSETGEDTAELQLHGGRAVVAGVLEVLARLPRFRPAEAGEFTRRAFENGRLDLTQVEGLADLIYADTAAQRRQAFRHLKGLLRERAETWRTRLIEMLALVEAGIDFSDEGDVPDDLTRPALQIARQLHDEIAEALSGAARGERLRDGMVVAIAGPPNAGKSTLLNRLARREAAIVSPYAGTTRDVIEVHLDLDGYPVTLLDTAGIRDSDDPVEQEGVRRARARAAEADLVLWVVDATTMGETGGAGPETYVSPHHAPNGAGREVSERTDETPTQIPSPAAPAQVGTLDAALSGTTGPHSTSVETWLVLNKIDLASRSLSTAGSTLDSERHLRAPFPSLGIPSRARAVSAQYPSAASTYDDLTASPHINLTTSPDANVTASPGANITTSPDANLAASPSRLPHLADRQHAIESEFMFTKLSVSARDGSGIDALASRLTQYSQAFFTAGEPALVTRARHRAALDEVRVTLARVIDDDFSGREDVLAEELRLASRALGRLTGRVDVEELLDVIFRDFCIGK